MEIKSEQQFDVIQVTGLDIAFPGDLQSYDLREGEADITEDPEAQTLTITFTTGGTVVFQLKYAHWVARRTHTIRVAKPETQTKQE